MKHVLAALLIALPLAAPAQDRAGMIRGIVEEEIVGGFAELEGETGIEHIRRRHPEV